MGQLAMIQSVAAKLDIRPSELRSVALSMVLMFVAGCALTYTWAAPFTFFLSAYDGNHLPQIYLAVAALGLLYGVIYNFFETRVLFRRLIIGLLISLAWITAAFWLTLVSSTSKVTYIALLIGSMVAFDLIDFVVWSALNHMYTLQQGKRLFGIIATAQSIGGIVAGFTLPLLLKWVHLEQIILFNALLLFSAAGVLAALFKHFESQNLSTESHDDIADTDHPDIATQRKNSWQHILRNHFVLKFFALIALVTSSMYVVDMFFNLSAQTYFTNQAALAGFLGIFFGVLDGACLMVNSFVVAWFLRRFGLIASLFILPVTGSIIVLAILISTAIPSLLWFTFWLVASLKLAEECIRLCITTVSNLLLLQPLSPDTRAFVMAKSVMVITPISTGLISTVLIVMSRVDFDPIYFFSVSILAISLGSALIIVTLKKDYIKVLSQAIKSRYSFKSTRLLASKESLPLLRQHLQSRHPDAIIYALRIMEQIDEKEFINQLGTILKSEHAILREFALKKLETHLTTNPVDKPSGVAIGIGASQLLSRYKDQLLLMLDHDPNDQVRAQALTTLAKVHSQHDATWSKTYSQDHSPAVCCAALLLCFTQGSDAEKNHGQIQLEVMIQSPQEQTRIVVAHLIGELNQSAINLMLHQLVHDQSPQVRREAFNAVIKTKERALFRPMLQSLADLRLDQDHLGILAQLADTIVPIVKTDFNLYHHPNKIKILSLFGKMPGHLVQLFLEEMILSDQNDLCQTALNSLTNLVTEKEARLTKKVKKQLHNELNQLKQYYARTLLIPDVAMTLILRDVLQQQIKQSVNKLLSLLALIYDKKVITKAKKGLDIGNKHEISYAIELIGNSLSHVDKKNIIPLLNSIYFSEEQATSTLASLPFHQVLKDGLTYPGNDPLAILYCMGCIYIIKLAKITELYPDVNALKNSSLALINETVDWEPTELSR